MTRVKLALLRKKGGTIAEISQILRVTQSDVIRMVRLFDLPKVDMANLDKKRMSKSLKVSKVRYAESSVKLSDDNGLTSIEKAKNKLKDRVEEKNGSYWLDGSPVSSFEVLKAAGMLP